MTPPGGGDVLRVALLPGRPCRLDPAAVAELRAEQVGSSPADRFPQGDRIDDGSRQLRPPEQRLQRQEDERRVERLDGRRHIGALPPV